MIILSASALSCRDLSHRITEADCWSISSWWVSREQRGGHQRAAHHGRAKGQQAAVLPKPVTMTTNRHPQPHRTFTTLCTTLISRFLSMCRAADVRFICVIYIFPFDSFSTHICTHTETDTRTHTYFWHEIKFYSTNSGDVCLLNVLEIMAF